jgi:hypothetical protein
MPNDAKCGLVVGLGVVVTAAVLFVPTGPPQTEPAPPPVVQTKSRAPAAAVGPPESAPVPAVPVSYSARPSEPRP